MNILQDIWTAANVFGVVRKARKDGASAVQVKAVHTIPVYDLPPAYYNTIEGCLFHKLGPDIDRAVMDGFDGLPYETKRALEFSPKNSGEWVARARFW